MQQNIIDHQYMTTRGRQSVGKLNREAPPLSIKSKNNMKMRSKSFPVTRRADNATTNVSPKAVSRVTSGRPGAGKSIGKKRYLAKRVVQVQPAQRSMTGPSPIKRTVSTQPRPLMTPKTRGGHKPSYLAVKHSLRKTMGY